MKKKLLYLACLIIIACSVTSCDVLSKSCKTCKKVYYIGTTYDHEDSATQYCGAELVTIEATGTANVGNYSVKWECN